MTKGYPYKPVIHAPMHQTTIPMKLQIPPCTAQAAGHPSMQSDPAKLRAGSTTILAAGYTLKKLKEENEQGFKY